MSRSLRLLTLCTGNAARSVMLGYMLTTLAESNGWSWQIRTAGTHAVEGLAMGPRTLRALEGLEALGPHHYRSHRSHQVTAEDVEWADLILATEARQVTFVREHFRESTPKTVSLGQLARTPREGRSFDDLVAALERDEPSRSFDVADPAGGEQDAYDACARELWTLAQAFADLIEGPASLVEFD